MNVRTANGMGKWGASVVGALREIRALSGREAAYLQAEFASLRSLPGLLARLRCADWNDADSATLREQLRRASRLSPYLLATLLPGSFLALPLIAWWRDRQRPGGAVVSGNR